MLCHTLIIFKITLFFL